MIHIFCALHCEAQPLIQHFKLTELKQFDLFRLFQSENKEISLTITGVGKLNAASAVSYHYACIKTNNSDIWLNIGVTGHINIPVGEVRLVNKITDEHDNISWYPQIIFKAPCDSANLITLDKASTDYQETLFDMEASAFYQMAIRLGTAELIHCLKIVSDNKDQSTSTVNADKVKTIIAKQTHTLDKLIGCLTPLSKELNSTNSEPEHYQECNRKWHFSQTEQLQLSRLLRQWIVRFPDNDVMQSLCEIDSGKNALITLSEKIKNAEFLIHD